MNTNIITNWPHGNMVTNLNADRVDGKHASELGGVIDHGSLLGLADDDHTQYHNNTRGDARYAGAGWDTTTTLKTAQNHIARRDNPHSVTLGQLGHSDNNPEEEAPGYGTKGEPTREEIELWGDRYDDVGITGTIAPNYVPRWNGAINQLVTSDIYNDPAGNVGIGTSSLYPTAKLDVNGNTVVRGVHYLAYSDCRIQAVSIETSPFLAFIAYPPLISSLCSVLVPPQGGFVVANAANNVPNMWVKNNGDLQIAGSYFPISDDRIKFNEQRLEYGLAQVMALEPKRYDRVEYEYDQTTEEVVIHPEKIFRTNEIGLVAQDVQDVIPEAVSIPEDENRQLWSISYDTLIPVLVKAIQEQQAQIEALKQENQTLVARVAPLESGSLIDTLLTANFDGDGKTDRAMVDANGQWYFWLSGSGYVKIGPFHFGVIGKPMAGDFDGDGKADPGIVDSDGNWHVWLSGSGYSQSKL